jgi:hypothetical protein
MSPTQRTLKWLREHGIEAQVVEKVVPHSYIKQDLFGAIDIVALPQRILGIQTTSGANHAVHAKSAAANTKIMRWLQCGGDFEIWSWSERVARKKDGSKAKRGRWVRRVAVAHFPSDLDKTKLEFREEEEPT